SVHPILVNVIPQNILTDCLQIWHKHPLGLKDELIRFRWSEVKVTVTSQNTQRNHKHFISQR
ncbi:hypothetical protein DVA76_19100, partial [Acinetobacter baumannii]